MCLKKAFCPVLTAIVLLGFSVIESQASLVVIGDINLIAAPSDISVGAIVDPTNVTAFVEQTNVAAPAIGGTNPSIAEGTLVNSYFFSWNPQATVTQTDKTFSGTKATFSNTILAVYHIDADLDATDASFGLSSMGTTYPSGLTFRGTRKDSGADNGESNDSFTVSGNMLTINRLFTNDPGIDQIRVITAVPEPTSFALFGLALIGFARRRR